MDFDYSLWVLRKHYNGHSYGLFIGRFATFKAALDRIDDVTRPRALDAIYRIEERGHSIYMRRYPGYNLNLNHSEQKA